MGGGGAEQELSRDNVKGIVLALLSSGFIGASFIIKKKGLRRAAVASGIRAGVGGYSYLLEPLWWVGMITSKDWSGQSLGSITSEICGLIVVLSGTILLHVTKDYERIPQSISIYAPLSPSLTTRLNGELLEHGEDSRTSDKEKVLRRQEMY